MSNDLADPVLLKRVGVICPECGATETDKVWRHGHLAKAIKVESLRKSGQWTVRYCTCRAHRKPVGFRHKEITIKEGDTI